MQGISGLATLDRLRKPGFVRNVFVVMSGTAIAQIISFGFSPILSRLFGPADFGVFGAFLSVAGIFGAVATLNFTDALLLPEKDEDAAPLFLFACFATTAVALGTAVFCLIVPTAWLKLLGMGDLGRYLWFLPASVLLTGLAQCLTAWCSRLKSFKETSQAQVIRSVTACAAQAATGIASLGSMGLIGGSVVAEAPTAMFLGRTTLLKSASALRTCDRWETLWRKAVQYREFALYGCPQNLMNTLSQGIPVLVLAHYYGAVVAGFYAFGIKLPYAPINLVSTSIRQVLFQRLSQINASGEDLASAVRKSTNALVAVSIVPACVGFLVAPSAFSIVFGEEWRQAGHYARWLLLWLGAMFCTVPSTLALRLLRLQRELFLFDLAHLIVRVAILVLGGLWLEALQTIVALGLVGALFNTALILYVGLRLRNRCHASHALVSNAPHRDDDQS